MKMEVPNPKFSMQNLPLSRSLRAIMVIFLTVLFTAVTVPVTFALALFVLLEYVLSTIGLLIAMTLALGFYVMLVLL
jgi:type III secretory pathway component EscU